MDDETRIMVTVIALGVGVAVLAGLFLSWIDRLRIRGYFISRGGRALKIKWAPFQWDLGERGSRYYRIRFQDEYGDVHDAMCRLNLFSRVYFADDRTVYAQPRSDQDDENARLNEENERLREEIERLKNETGQQDLQD